MQIAGCIPAYPTRGKGAPRPLLSALAGASKRETPTSNLTEITAPPLLKGTHDKYIPWRAIENCSVLFDIGRTKYSLNEVSHDTAIGLINLLLSSGINVHEVKYTRYSKI